MVNIHAETLTTRRLHGLDALRAGALLLGIVLHGLMPFTPGDLWLVNDRFDAPAVLALIGPIHLFRMALFLLIAGFFAPRSLERRGTLGYLKDRTLRLLLPMFAFWPIAVVPLGLMMWAQAAAAGKTLPAPATTNWSPGQLWFLWVLFECILITLVARALLTRALGVNRIQQGITRVGRTLTAPGGVLLAAVPYALAMIVQHSPGGIAEPPDLIPEVGGLIGYFGAFAVGWAVSRTPEALPRLQTQWPLHAVGAGVGTLYVVVTIYLPSLSVPVPFQSLVMGIVAWCWVYALVGLVTKAMTTERAWVRYLADASYWLYLLHLPLLVWGEFQVADLGWPVPLKILVVWSAAFAVMLSSYDLLVRSTWVGRWLNGRRYPRVVFSRRKQADEVTRRADVH